MILQDEKQIITMVQSVYGIPAGIFDQTGSVVLEVSDGLNTSKPTWYYNIVKDRAKLICIEEYPVCDVDEIGYTWSSYPLTKDNAGRYLIVGPLYVQSFHVRFNDDMRPGDPAIGSNLVPPTYRWDVFTKLLDTISYQLYQQEVKVRVLRPQCDDQEDDYIPYTEYIATHPDVVEQRRCGFRLMQFILNCIESGNAEDLYMVISDAAFSDFTMLLMHPVKEYYTDYFAYVAALSASTAIKAGVSDFEATETYSKYMKQMRKVDSIHKVIQCMIKMWLDFVYMVRSQECVVNHSPLVHRVFGYINNHINDSINISDMSETVGVSSGYLMRNFKRETGKTVNEYIKEEKLKRACIYLKFFDYSIVDISERLAFCSQSHFAGIFKSVYGISPGEYRKNANTMPLGQ